MVLMFLAYDLDSMFVLDSIQIYATKFSINNSLAIMNRLVVKKMVDNWDTSVFSIPTKHVSVDY